MLHATLLFLFGSYENAKEAARPQQRTKLRHNAEPAIPRQGCMLSLHCTLGADFLAKAPGVWTAARRLTAHDLSGACSRATFAILEDFRGQGVTKAAAGSAAGEVFLAAAGGFAARAAAGGSGEGCIGGPGR